MKKMTLVVLGVVGIMGFVGCQKKEAARSSVEEPIVTEETTVAALANLEMNAVNMVNATVTNVEAGVNSAVPSALEAVSSTVEQSVAAVIENPTPLQVQEALKNAGYYEGKLDGSIGPKTKRAIEKFQSENGLKPDGKVGPKTWAKLGVHLAANVASAAAAAAPATEPILGTDSSMDMAAQPGGSN